eukprot:TRINITY_DN22598_c0_g1_i1.p1 TRINITY_DN22598_c0_g1~~TRINITY_DN22598_c0_g1_i1.p1  ORF type:complete len:337 (+),score=40.18 TRINITY_DN22598_c0_g1_i1:66-1076(+)
MGGKLPMKPERRKKKRVAVDYSGKVFGEYSVLGSVGSGSFSDCFEGKNLRSGEVICMKFEERASREAAKAGTPQRVERLETEYKIMHRLSGSGYTPETYGFLQASTANILVLELLGPSLDSLLKKGVGYFSHATTAMVAASIMDCMAYVHGKGILHRDIKPHNFVIGNDGHREKVFIIDFGLAKKYITDGHHSTYRSDRPFVGTARYVSINTHKGSEQGRRDDLEALAYVFIYFMKGSLPWQGLGIGGRLDKKARLNLVCESKASCTPESLCEGLPNQFLSYLSYVRRLSFKSKPDYEQLKALFLTVDGATNTEPDWVTSGLAAKLVADRALKKPV